MNNILIKNWVKFLAQAMKEQGCPSEIRTEEDILSNLFYLSKEDNRGSRYIPLQYKRIVEKIVCGLFNSAFEYEDGKDVYFEKIGDITVCTANVFWIQYLEDGSKRVLGHGFHSLSMDEVMPGVFMSEAERASKWKSTVIGAAKSRALHDGGIGLEFYGDIFAPDENLDEAEKAPVKEEPKKTTSEKKSSKVAADYSESGMPIPKPKRAPKKEEPEPEQTPEPVQETKVEVKEEADVPSVSGMSLEFAKTLKADIGNCAGMCLGEIYNVAPKNLVFLARNSSSDDVITAAKVIITSDPELSAKFAV